MIAWPLESATDLVTPERSGAEWTVMVTVLVWSPDAGSSGEARLATLEMVVPSAMGLAICAMKETAVPVPRPTLGSVQVMVREEAVKVPPRVAETKLKLGSSTSLITVVVVAASPVLIGVMVYWS